MTKQVVNTLISYILPLILGYLIKTIQTYSKKEKTQNEALKCLLRNAITTKYYIYKELGIIPQYEKANVNMLNEQYTAMKGNSYVQSIVKEMNEWKTK